MNTPPAICLRDNHKILIVEDLLQLVNLVQDRYHQERIDCACNICIQLRNENCIKPYHCLKEGAKLLQGLSQKWIPRNLSLNEINDRNILNNQQFIRPDGLIKFNPYITSEETIQSEFCVFTDNRLKIPTLATPLPNVESIPPPHFERVSIATATVC